MRWQISCLGDWPKRLSVVIHGRSKERSDARRPEDPFRDFKALRRSRILHRCTLRSMQRHGS
ncbi:hypothetical protein MPLB_1590009 [Mesorhizobium sp. ORS 3324]|nr:hypothetical protein MPLB_1590009 [Mesorhizobium sp. ORS 3324]